MKKLIRKEETSQGLKVEMYIEKGLYKVHLEKGGVFTFDEYNDADLFTGMLRNSDFKPV
jgi:hypothetical protein